MSSLNYQQRQPQTAGGVQQAAGVPAGGGKKTDRVKFEKSDNVCCNSFACSAETRGSDGCICKAGSKMGLNKIMSRGRMEYVKLMRQYNQANPTKSLKVSIKLVREAIDGPKTNGSVAFMATAESVVGSDVNNADDFETWLSEHDGTSFYALGSLEGEGASCSLSLRRSLTMSSRCSTCCSRLDPRHDLPPTRR